MTFIAVGALLREVSRLAGERVELVTGLRASGLPGADRVADALADGQSLADVLRADIGQGLADWLAADRPGLEVSAALAAEEIDLSIFRRRCLVSASIYPFVSLVALMGVSAWLMLTTGLGAPAGWLWAAQIVLACTVIILLKPPPWLWSAGRWVHWRRHAALAGRYARAAIAARWRLPEADCQPLLGDDLQAVAPYLGRKDAEACCQHLSQYHAKRAIRHARLTGIIISCLIYLAGAMVAFAVATNIWAFLVDEMAQTYRALEAAEGAYLP